MQINQNLYMLAPGSLTKKSKTIKQWERRFPTIQTLYYHLKHWKNDIQHFENCGWAVSLLLKTTVIYLRRSLNGFGRQSVQDASSTNGGQHDWSRCADALQLRHDPRL